VTKGALYLHLDYFSKVRIKSRLKMSPRAFRRQLEARYQQLLPIFSSICTSYESLPQATPQGGPQMASVKSS
jgi:hypothetical protein